MAWYFGPRDSAKSGLKRVKLAYKMPMNSTGKEKFTVYVFYKTQKYDPNNPWSDSESEAEDESSSSEGSDSDNELQEETCLNRSPSANHVNGANFSGQINKPNSNSRNCKDQSKHMTKKREAKAEMKIEINKSQLTASCLKKHSSIQSES